MAPITLEVFSDLACPWCFIGLKRLEHALARLPPGTVELHWRAYELQPQLPPEGLDARAFFTAKFGPPERQRQIFSRVQEAGLTEGIHFDFERMARAPNTRMAHRMVKLAAERAQATLAKRALFKAHFEEGLDIGRVDTALARLAKEGVDVAGFAERLEQGHKLEDVIADERLAGELGVSGVPLFLANRRQAVSGAQPTEVLLRLFELAQASTSTPP